MDGFTVESLVRSNSTQTSLEAHLYYTESVSLCSVSLWRKPQRGERQPEICGSCFSAAFLETEGSSDWKQHSAKRFLIMNKD